MLSRFIKLAVLCLSLGGCGSGGLSGLVTDGEVLILQSAKGKDIQTARTMAMRSGFECTEPKHSTKYVHNGDYYTPIDAVTCNQRPMLALICPERRFITFLSDPKTGKVVQIASDKQITCF